jgi:hypothetical protein
MRINKKGLNMRTAPVIVILLLSCCSLALAAQRPEVTGRDLLHKMDSKIRSDKDYVLGFVGGVYATYLGTSSIPPETEIKKVVKTARKYLRHNSEKLEQPAARLLNEAFEKAYSKKPKS